MTINLLFNYFFSSAHLFCFNLIFHFLILCIPRKSNTLYHLVAKVFLILIQSWNRLELIYQTINENTFQLTQILLDWLIQLRQIVLWNMYKPAKSYRVSQARKKIYISIGTKINSRPNSTLTNQEVWSVGPCEQQFIIKISIY